ncbi:MAG: DEAD/DEAH box helicase [Chloroflexi bacterium]|nr:DEAD/DEAH box helicase [Chloroflexota bacterium]
MNPQAFLDELRRKGWYQGQVVHVEHLPPRSATYGELEQPLHPLLRASLERLGLLPLYRHQAGAISALWRGENVILTTPAASGKSMAYQVPTLQAVLEDRTARALFLYPTKALAQDQHRSLASLVPPGEAINFAIYDGDTPHHERAAIRRQARVLLSNPDMLHVGILPNHKVWAGFLRGLRYVVVDEAHIYRGVFGSHMADLLRRLRRLCLRYGSRPQFILCSATIANPAELAERLVGLPFTAAAEDGAPFGGKAFAFWNPPVTDEQKGTRRGASGEATVLFVELLRRGVRTLAFVRTRRQAELVYRYARDGLAHDGPGLAQRIAPYRGTYLPEDRRRIEHELFSGRLLGAVSTNALELGVDIGSLDATVLTGYPGSVASAWQQAGRSGRRGEPSLTVLVARDDPLDQYLMRHPDFFFGRPHEQALIAPENPYILKPHLLCAAYEAPLTEADATLFGTSFPQRVAELEEEGLLRHEGTRWFLTPEMAYPAEQVDLRTSGGHSYTIVERSTGRVLEQGISESSAFAQLHPGAVYLHQGEPFVVAELDRVSHSAYVEREEVPYYTQVRELTDTRILKTWKEKPAPGGSKVFLGEVEVTTQVVAFKKVSHYSDELLGEEVIDLPPHRFRTVALWFEVPDATYRGILARREDLAGGLHAAEHAAIGVLPLFALCDRNDIGGVSTPLHPDTGKPAVFIHDGYPGGIGIAERGYDIIEQLWEATLRAVSECPCEAGCPGCIHSPKCGNNNHPLDKAVAVTLLKAVLGRG